MLAKLAWGELQQRERGWPTVAHIHSRLKLLPCCRWESPFRVPNSTTKPDNSWKCKNYVKVSKTIQLFTSLLFVDLPLGFRFAEKRENSARPCQFALLFPMEGACVWEKEKEREVGECGYRNYQRKQNWAKCKQESLC